MKFKENSSVYQYYKEELNEILKHKWIESEKAGRDIGFNRALIDWVSKHRNAWRESIKKASPKNK
jgi:hypothetical protein